MSYLDMEPKAMGQLKAEAAKAAHDQLMAVEDSSPEAITAELNKSNPWVAEYDNGLTRDETYSYLLTVNRGAW